MYEYVHLTYACCLYVCVHLISHTDHVSYAQFVVLFRLFLLSFALVFAAIIVTIVAVVVVVAANGLFACLKPGNATGDNVGNSTCGGHHTGAWLASS